MYRHLRIVHKYCCGLMALAIRKRIKFDKNSTRGTSEFLDQIITFKPHIYIISLSSSTRMTVNLIDPFRTRHHDELTPQPLGYLLRTLGTDLEDQHLLLVVIAVVLKVSLDDDAVRELALGTLDPRPVRFLQRVQIAVGIHGLAGA